MIKSKIAGLFLLAGSVAYAQSSGVFVGGILGASINGSKQEATYNGLQYGLVNGAWQNSQFTTYGSSSKSESTTNLLYGLRLGYVLALNDFNAFRIYGTFNAGNFTTGVSDKLNGFGTNDYYFMQVGGAIDYMLSFSRKPNAWGAFVGGGYEYGFGKFAKQIKDIKDSSVHIPYINFGIFKAFGAGHFNLEIGGKVPFVTYFDITQPDVYWYDGEQARVQGDVSKKFSSTTNFQLYVALNYKF